MKVSVVYCTARHGGLDILEQSVQHQTHPDIEVILVDELRRGTSNFKHPSLYHNVNPPPKKLGTHWNLSASLNAGCRAASGDIIVLLQDYIWLPPDAIAKYIQRYLDEGMNQIISGVGHQYSEPSTIDNPIGLYSVWNRFPGPPSGNRTFTDPRASKNGYYITCPVEWEANWGSFPKEAWQLVGGFDEDFDLGWGYDNVNFAERCQLAGYHIMLDTHNEVFCYDHILLFGEKKHREESPNNQALWHRKYRDMHKLKAPWKLNYASSS